MPLLDVYNQFPITITHGSGARISDDTGKAWLDFYGGHGVISVGHNHPYWRSAIEKQMSYLSFYSNAVINPLQTTLADRFCAISGYNEHQLFLCNSGAEANENALKIASLFTGREECVSLKDAFHGRTAGAVSLTDNPFIQAPFHKNITVHNVPINDIKAIEQTLSGKTCCAIIIEGIQGVGGVNEANSRWFSEVRDLCTKTGTILILDEIQSGCGRTGTYFAHQAHSIEADIITMAKGIGNGFPAAGLLIAPHISVSKGMLGTTFGGNHLACAAMLAVLDILEDENLLFRAKKYGTRLISELSKCKGIKSVKGRGLMLGLDFGKPAKSIIHKCVDAGLFVGSSSNPNVLRLLPPLTITDEEITEAIQILTTILTQTVSNK